MAPGLIVGTELVRSARRTRYFLLRVGYAAVLLGALGLNYLSTFGLQGAGGIHAEAAFAAAFLSTFAFLQLCAVVLLGPALLAGGVAREREQRTLEYLLTTQLTSAELVLGKLASGLLQLFACLLVGLPILSLAMLLGGIDPVGLALAFLVAGSSGVAVGGLSMAVSVLCRRARDAVSTVYLLLLLLLSGPWLAVQLLDVSGMPAAAGALAALLRLNPFVVLTEILLRASPGGAAELSGVWWIAFGHVAFASVCVAAATAALRPTFRRQWAAAMPTRSIGPGRRSRRPPVGRHPMIWKEVYASRPATRTAAAFRVLGGIALAAAGLATVGMFMAAVAGRSETYTYFTAGTGTALGCGAILMATTRASGAIAGEREQSTWVTLLSTPLAPREMLLGKIVGQLYAVRWAGVLLLLMWALQCAVEPRFVVAAPVLAVELTVLTTAGVLLGLFFSLWCRTATRALGATLGTGLAVGLGCCPASCILPSPLTMLTWPYFLLLEDTMDPFSMTFLSATVLAGMVGYGAVGVGLYFACERNFDRWGGRVHRQGVPVPRASPQQVAAEQAKQTGDAEGGGIPPGGAA